VIQSQNHVKSQEIITTVMAQFENTEPIALYAQFYSKIVH